MSGAFQKAWKQQRRPHPSERSVQSCVVAFLLHALPSDAVLLAIPNGDGKVTTMPGTLVGAPDLLIIYRGRSIFIELKSETGIVRQSQREAHDRLTLAGAVVVTLRSVEAVADFLHPLIPLRARVAA